MTATTSTGSSGWKVTAQRQTQELGAGNQFVKGVEVSFQTGLGVLGTVFVPEAQYPDGVPAAVAARAAAVDAVSNLSAPPASS